MLSVNYEVTDFVSVEEVIADSLKPGNILEIAISQYCDRFKLLDYLYLVIVRNARWGPREGEGFGQKTEIIGGMGSFDLSSKLC